MTTLNRLLNIAPVRRLTEQLRRRFSAWEMQGKGVYWEEQWADRWTAGAPLHVGMVLIALALSGLFVGTLAVDRYRVREGAVQSLQNVSLAVQEHLFQVFAESERLLVTAKGAVAPVLDQLDGDVTKEALSGSLGTLQLPPYAHALVVTNAAGETLGGIGSIGPLGQQALKSHLQQVTFLNQTLLLSPLVPLSRDAGAEVNPDGVLFISQPVFSSQGDLTGWVNVAIKPSYFGPFFRAMDLGIGGTVVLVRQDGRVVLRSPAQAGGYAAQEWAGGGFFAALQTSPKGVFEGVDPFDGVDRLYAHGESELLPITVVVGEAKQDVYANWTDRAVMLGVFAAVALGVIAVLVRKLGSYLNAVQGSRLRYRSAEEHLSQAQALAHLGSWQWVLADNSMWWSAEMKRLCGLSAHDANRQPSYDLFLALVHPSDRARVAISIGHALDDGQSFEIDHRLLLADGTIRHVHQEGQCVLDEQGAVSRLDCVLQDVTQAAILQAQLADAAKLSTLGEMASGMAHELSQPLNIITMTTEGALMDLDGLYDRFTAPSGLHAVGEPAPVMRSADTSDLRQMMPLRDALQRIANQAQRMGQVLDHIRIFSRRDSGPAEVFDAVAIIRETVDVVSGTLDDAGVSLRGGVPEDIHAPVMGHAVQLEQVLMNLLINAKEAVLAAGRTPSGEERGVPRGWINLSARRVGSDFQILIQDSGLGIPEGKLDRLFEPFFTTKEAGAGPGLGLSVAYGIISAMGGKLSVRNAPQGGAIFELRLPIHVRSLDEPLLHRPPSAALRVLHPPVAGGAKGKIDLPARKAEHNRPPYEATLAADVGMEDGQTSGHGHQVVFFERQSGTLMAMRMHLARKGFITTTAETLSEAEAMVRANDIAVLITDHIRVVDGDNDRYPQVCGMLRAIDPMLPIVVVVPMTLGGESVVGDGEAEDRDLGIHWIRQTVDMAALYDVVNAVYRRP